MKHVVVGLISRANDKEESEYLLVSVVKSSFGEYSGAYYPPGGHLEAGESEQQALSRELKEELNLQVLPDAKIAETPGDVKDQITHWWRCKIIGGELKHNTDELTDARFFTEEEIKSLRLWPATKKFFEDYIFFRKG